MLNWALQLSGYDYNIVHIPSKLNDISDCLSRMEQICIISNIPPLIDINQLKTEQSNDKEITNALEYLLQGKVNFDIDQLGDLKRFRKCLNTNKEGVLVWNDTIVVPSTLRKRVLESCHDNPLSGHFASERALLRVSRNYFWPYAKTDVENWVHSCKTCNEFNSPNQGYVKRPLVPIDTSRRFELVCYDLAGPFVE